MKKFRKDKKRGFVCEECNSFHKNKGELAKHINKCHIGTKNYYDIWIKENDENLCKICKKKTEFISISVGYKNCCCKKCEKEYNIIKTKESLLKKYGVDNYAKTVECKEKAKQTKKERYGDENYNNRQQSEKTCLKKYGNKTYCHSQKYKQKMIELYGVEYIMQNKNMQLKSINTCIEHFGVKYSLQSPEIREKGNNSKQLNHGDKNFNNRHKSKETCLNKYGVEHISQVPDIFKKQRKSSLSIKKFKDTNIWYQGSYEQDFLEKYYVIYPDIQRASPIKYQYKGKNKIYYPDFYIPSLNLIIEIKNKWLAKKDKEIISAKENAAIMNGFNYIMIIEKNYELFPTS